MRTGGRTSLVAGLVTAYEVRRRHRQRERQTQPLQGLLTGGRANVRCGTGDPVGAAFQHASRPRDAGVSPWGVATFDEMTRSEAIGTLVLTNTPQ
jgi:Mg-chelatase subunit ChlD